MLSYRYQLSVFNGVFLSLKNSLPSRDIILPLIHIERLIFLLFLNQNFSKTIIWIPKAAWGNSHWNPCC